MDKLIHPTAESTHSPYLLNNIECAARAILTGIVLGHRIHTQIDADCDGYASAAILLNYLHRVFPATVENNFTFSVHSGKQHGIDEDRIPEGVSLVIAPDASSNEHELHKKLFAERNILTVVLDHHQAEEDTDDSAIIVNNQMCDYPNKALCGGGIVYKFCKVLDDMLGVSYADDYLDLVSLSCVSDMMDLRDPETHFYVTDGAEKVKNIFYNKLIEKQEFSMKGEVNPFTIGWYIAPLINAITRSGTIEEKQLIFEAFLDYRAVTSVFSNKRGAKNGEEELLVEQAIRTAANVKNRQERVKKDILEMILPQVEEQVNNLAIFIIFDEPIDENLNGLLANQIMGNYHKPTFVLNRREDGTLGGSARGLESRQVPDWRWFVEESGCAIFAQGHPLAFGVAFTESGLTDFKVLLNDVFGTAAIEPYYNIDFQYFKSDSFDFEIMELGGMSDLWGQGLSEPIVILSNIRLDSSNVSLLGKGTLRIDIPGHETNCIKFNAEDLYNKLELLLPDNDASITVNIIGTCAINTFRGVTKPQIKIKDIEVTQQSKWTF